MADEPFVRVRTEKWESPEGRVSWTGAYQIHSTRDEWIAVASSYGVIQYETEKAAIAGATWCAMQAINVNGR